MKNHETEAAAGTLLEIAGTPIGDDDTRVERIVFTESMFGPPFEDEDTEDYHHFDLSPREHLMPDVKFFPSLLLNKCRARLQLIDARIYWSTSVDQKVETELLAFRKTYIKGVGEFALSPAEVTPLAKHVSNAGSYDEKGFLMFNGKSYPGYQDYWQVQAEEHDPDVQSVKTVVVNGLANVQSLLDESMEVRSVLAGVLRVLGVPPLGGRMQSKQPAKGTRCKVIHLLIQDASKEADFKWHSDEIGSGRVKMSADMYTVVVNLSPHISAMHRNGLAPHIFRQPGDACIFPGFALHESVPRLAHTFTNGILPTVHKIVFFFDH